jgi:F0F1-type ATP synthase assembly protein I
MAQSNGGSRGGFSTLLVVLIGQMGCLTVIVIALSVLAGLWLDNNFHTKPIFTLVLLLAGVPVSVFLMLLVARKSLEKFKPESAKPAPDHKERV